MTPQLASLADGWAKDATGQDQPDWTRLRAFLDDLAPRPEEVAVAIQAKPPLSGSGFFDNLLAGIAEKPADDSGIPRPAWTEQVPELDYTWNGFGTPRMLAAQAASTPAQLAQRNIRIPANSLWRDKGSR